LATNTLTDYMEGKLLDLVFGGVAYTPPATIYLAVHLATALAAAPAAGATSISTNDSIPVGSSLTINFGQPNAETRTCTAVTGAGPFTVSFTAALGQTHLIGEPVAFDPSDTGVGLKEPVGGAYARLAITNNTTNFPAAAAGLKTLAVAQSFAAATANWGWQTHLVAFDAATGGNALSVHVQATPQQINNGNTLTVPATTGFRLTLD
jgi:hypothetical protein